MPNTGWFSESANLHFLGVVLLLLLLVGSCFLPKPRKRWNVFFEFLILAAVLVGRLPAILAGRLSNPDESQIIAGAATLWERPEFWKWVDGTTIGPLSFYSLWLGKLLAIDFGYAGARLMSAVFFAGTLIALYRFLRNHFPEVVARVSTVPFAAFGCLVLFWDIVQYGNEAAAIFFLSLGMALAFPGREFLGLNYVRMAGAGMALGAVPFAKLHVGPMAVFVGVTALIAVIRRFEQPGRPGRVFALIAGALVLPSIVAVYLSIYGLRNQFFTSYLANNYAYARSADYSTLQLARALFSFLEESHGVLQLFLGTIVFAATCIWFVPRFSGETRKWSYWSLGWMAVSLVSLLLPGRDYIHYQLMLIPPLFILCGSILAGMHSLEKPPASRLALIVLFIATTTIPLASVRLLTHHSTLSGLRHFDDELEEAFAEIRSLSKPGERMAIWGWQPELWVDTGLIQATRDGNTFRQIEQGSFQGHYRARFLFDLNRNIPPLFLDAVGPGRFAFRDRTAFGHETWPALSEFVAEHYVLHSDIAGVRIYLRRDRASYRSK